jgi:hypothetical protein
MMGKVTDFKELFKQRYPEDQAQIMYEYYMLGVRDAAQDVIDTLDDYACALSGTGQEHAYDQVSANLYAYFKEYIGCDVY